MQYKLSIAEENYIKAIYHLQQKEGNVTTNEVATQLDTKAASVTDMIKKLKLKKILDYEKYYGVRLSKIGNKLALIIIRKHRLWEYFLVNKLQFDWHEVHEVAEELEHIRSIKLIDKLDQYLNYPKFDPHGDPIPDGEGVLPEQHQINLTDLPLNVKAKISLVGSQNKELLELLKHKNISIGTSIMILQKFVFDHSVEVKIDKQMPFNISQQLAQTLYVLHQ